MKSILKVVPCLLLISAFCHTASLPAATVERIRSLTLEGLSHAYNLDLDSANRLFDDAIALEPLHPRPYVGQATIRFWRVLIGRKESDRDEFFTLADRTIDAAEKFEDTYGKDAESRLCLGTIYAYRSFVEGRMKSYLKAAW